MMYGDISIPTAPPLPAAPPPTWAAREERVQWCLDHLTKGEHHLLYRLLHNTGVRVDRCKHEEAEERRALAGPQPKKETWP
jgi:hypothetical protein